MKIMELLKLLNIEVEPFPKNFNELKDEVFKKFETINKERLVEMVELIQKEIPSIIDNVEKKELTDLAKAINELIETKK